MSTLANMSSLYKSMLVSAQQKFAQETVSKKDILSFFLTQGVDEGMINTFLYRSRTLGFSPSRGKYCFKTDEDVEVTETVQTSTVAQKPVEKPAEKMNFQPIVKPKTQDISNYLIPKVDANYVKFGNYDTIERVINSSKFAPIWITGLSGNGKTYSVEQACANLSREMILINITNETNEEDLIGSFSLETVNSFEIDCDEELYNEFLATL